MTVPDVDVDYIYHDDERLYAIRLTMESCELHVHVRTAEAAKIADVRSRPWLAGALRIGESAGAPAFWCIGDDEESSQTMSILVGHDDQTWDFAVHVPVDVLDRIVDAIAQRDAEPE